MPRSCAHLSEKPPQSERSLRTLSKKANVQQRKPELQSKINLKTITVPLLQPVSAQQRARAVHHTAAPRIPSQPAPSAKFLFATSRLLKSAVTRNYTITPSTMGPNIQTSPALTDVTFCCHYLEMLNCGTRSLAFFVFALSLCIM